MPHLGDAPPPALRVALREWCESDAAALFSLAKDPAVGTAAGFPPHTDVAESVRVIREILSRPEHYAIVAAADGRLLGCIALYPERKGECVHESEEVFLGYWLGHPFWGLGLTAEAVGLLCSRCFGSCVFKCSKIAAKTKETNVRSRRVLEKAGFALAGTEEGECRYERTRTGWLGRRMPGCRQSSGEGKTECSIRIHRPVYLPCIPQRQGDLQYPTGVWYGKEWSMKTGKAKVEVMKKGLVDVTSLQLRLKKVVGQLNGIQKMLAGDEPCENVLNQLNAVNGALHRISFMILDAHLRHCVREGIEKGNADETIESFAEALENFSRMA